MKTLEVGMDIRSKEVRGLNAYTTSNGETLVVLWTTLLYENSMWGRYLSQDFVVSF